MPLWIDRQTDNSYRMTYATLGEKNGAKPTHSLPNIEAAHEFLKDIQVRLSAEREDEIRKWIEELKTKGRLFLPHVELTEERHLALFPKSSAAKV